MLARFIAQQLSKPEGLGGKLVRPFMNRVNAPLNKFAMDQLRIQASDRVLEIGFGGGLTLKPLLAQARFVCGVDPSADVVAIARRRFAASVSTGRAEFQEGAVEALPLPDEAFNKVLTVNTVYFWPSLELGMSEIRRVLAPSGRGVLGFTPLERMDRMNLPGDIFTSRSAEAIENALQRTGFIEVEMHAPWGKDEPMVATAITGH